MKEGNNGVLSKYGEPADLETVKTVYSETKVFFLTSLYSSVIMADATASLFNNELLKALEEDPAIGQNLKKVCRQLKQKSNHWQDQIRQQWAAIEYPVHDQASIQKMNTYMNKHVTKVNTQRRNQRAFYQAQGNLAAAQMLPDLVDDSITNKSAIILNDYQTLGWNPMAKEYVIIAFTKKPKLEDLAERIESCVHSQAINIPKSISNILTEGVERGFTAQNYTTVILQFIQKYIASSYISALTYCTNVEQLFDYLLTLIDTSSEIKKIRLALSSVSRGPKEPLAESALKVKALTSSLLFMMNPNSTLEEVDKRSNFAAQDSIYSFVTQKTRALLQNWKRTANQMSKEICLQEFLEAANNFEILPGNAPTETLSIPDRFSQADLWSNSFYARNGIIPERYSYPKKESKEGKKKKDERTREKRSQSSGDERGRGRRDSERRSGSESGRSSRSGSRGNQTARNNRSSSREHKKSDREKNQSEAKQHGSSGKDDKTRRHNSSSSIKNREYSQSSQNNCKKCGGRHPSKECNRYPYYYNEKCGKGCGFYHPTEFCRFNDSRYRTPERDTIKSPVSFRRKSPKDSNIFQTEISQSKN